MTHRHAVAALVLVLCLVAAAPSASAASLTRLSVPPAGATLGDSRDPAISADGRYVVFNSAARLRPDAPSGSNLYVYDRTARTLRTAPMFRPGGSRLQPGSFVLSPNGRFVAFGSGGAWVHDLATGVTDRADLEPDGDVPITGASYVSSVSSDGRFVAFTSTSSELVAGTPRFMQNAFLRDRANGTTKLVNPIGPRGLGALSGEASEDGRIATFVSNDQFDPADQNTFTDIYLTDFATGQTRLVTVGDGGRHINPTRDEVEVSGNGRYVAVQAGTTFMPGVPQNLNAVAVKDLQTGTWELASILPDGTPSSSRPEFFDMSADGRRVAFRTRPVPSAETSTSQGYVRDLDADATEHVTAGANGPMGDDYSAGPVVADERYAALTTNTPALAPDTCSQTFEVWEPDPYDPWGPGIWTPQTRTYACEQVYLYDAQGGTNAPPSCPDATVDVPYGGSVALQARCTDADGDPLTYSVPKGPSKGTLTETGNGAVTYRAGSGQSGTDSFTYVANDGTADSAPGTVTIRIAPPANASPSCPDAAVTVTVGGSRSLSAACTDPEGDALTYRIVSPPAKGSLTGAPDGSATYTPAPGASGTDSFTYAAHDGTSESNVATVTIALNRRPACAPVDTHVAPGGTVSLGTPCTDPDGDPLTWSSASPRVSGTDYAAPAGAEGFDELELQADDGRGGTDRSAVTVLVLTPGAATGSLPEGVELGAAPTAADPISVGVAGGSVAGSAAIDEVPLGAAPAGYALLGSEIRISAPRATAGDPLRLTFTVDGSTGANPADLTILRDGVPVDDACSADPADAGDAVPDPCVLPAEVVGGDVRITVLTSHASRWNAAVRTTALAASLHAPAKSGVVALVKPGRVVPVKVVLTIGSRAVTAGRVALTAPRQVACPAGAGSVNANDEAQDGGADGGTLLEWDPAGAFWRHDLGTRGLQAGVCHRFGITLNRTAVPGAGLLLMPKS